MILSTRFLCNSKHFIGSSRHQKNPSAVKPKEVFCQLGCRIGPVQKTLKALELIENDQVWLKRSKTTAGKFHSERPDYLALQLPIVVRDVLSREREPVA